MMQNQKLFQAAIENDLASVRNLLRSGANVNTKILQDMTTLHWACLYGHVELVKELVDDWDADIEAKDNNKGWTPLLWATCVHGRLPVVRVLLDRKADIHARCVLERTPLHWACHYGLAGDVVQEFISAGADIDAKDIAGLTPLHFAHNLFNLECIQALVGAGAHIRAVDLPITEALRGLRNSDATKYLMKEFYASIFKHEDRLPLHAILQDASADDTPLRKALEEDEFGTDDVLEIIAFLDSQNPGSLIARNQGGELPLHVASATCTPVEIVRFLVDRAPGSILVPRTTDGAYSLHVALERGASSQFEVIKLLLERHDPVTMMLRNNAGETPLHVACRCGVRFAIIQSLVHHYQASVQVVTPQGDLPLFLACAPAEPSLGVIYLLLQLYPDVVYP
jgi:ankyrin repeat protein